ncbi:MAG: hypothetical protein JST54_09190 [Deltaproteobacteria bacterium]|nr:hypothetical protein [Deltaproteobacteria bacterium]
MNRLLLFALLLVPNLAHAENPKELVGHYVMDFPGGSDALELRPDGTAYMGANETHWSAKGGKLTIGKDELPYTLAGKTLTLTMAGAQVPFKRIGDPGTGKPTAAKTSATELPPGVTEQEAMKQANAWLAAQNQAAGGKKGKGAPKEAASSSGQDQQVRVLLTSTAWCSATDGQFSADASALKVTFHPDGTLAAQGGGETESAAWTSASSKGAHWKLEKMKVLVDRGDGAGFKQVGTMGEQDASGFPIMRAQGQAFSMCR